MITNKKGMGIGNIQRCYHLSTLLEKKFRVFPILLGSRQELINPFKKSFKKFERINFNLIIEYLDKNNIKKIIIDYYFFPKTLLAKLRKKNIKIIKISDFNEKNDNKNYDLILNQYISNYKNLNNLNAIIINPLIKKYRKLKKKKEITIFFGYESKLEKIINFIKAIEKVDVLKDYKKILILFGKYNNKIKLLNKFNYLNIHHNPSNYFKIVCKSEIAFGEAGTSAIERDIFQIYSLNFITNQNQRSTKSILKKSKYTHFNKKNFNNSIKYFEKEILFFLKEKKRKKSSNDYNFFKKINFIKLIDKI